jgi:hypothetical protein
VLDWVRVTSGSLVRGLGSVSPGPSVESLCPAVEWDSLCERKEPWSWDSVVVGEIGGGGERTLGGGAKGEAV